MVADQSEAGQSAALREPRRYASGQLNESPMPVRLARDGAFGSNKEYRRHAVHRPEKSCRRFDLIGSDATRAHATAHMREELNPVDPELKRNAKSVIEKIHQLRDSL